MTEVMGCPSALLVVRNAPVQSSEMEWGLLSGLKAVGGMEVDNGKLWLSHSSPRSPAQSQSLGTPLLRGLPSACVGCFAPGSLRCLG